MSITVTPPTYVNTSQYGVSSVSVIGRSEFNQMLEDDLSSVFFNSEGVFTEPCVYTHVTGEVRTYNVLINTPHETFSILGRNNQSDRQMSAMVKESELIQRPSTNDEILVRGVSYYIKDVEPDGVGVTTLRLIRQAR